MEKNIVIGIEGLVGTGKSSMCNELLKYIPNSILFKATSVYRAIAYMIIKNNIEFESLKGVDIKEFYDKYNLEIKASGNQTAVFSDEKELSEKNLQSHETSLAVSIISNIADNRNAYKIIKDTIDKLKQNHNVILSCRDTMRIYPEIDYHFFIVADLEERVRRKCIQYESDKIDRNQIKKDIIKRDELQEKTGYYDKFDKTIEIDVTDCKNVEESTKKLLEFIKK